jgi:nitroreductase
VEFETVVRARRSVRAFRPDPVPIEMVRQLLTIASRAPSGTNVQPWKVHVVAGEIRNRLEREVLAHRETRPADDSAEFPRTSKRKEPYVSRMRALGKDMYSRIGIPRGDEAAGWRQWGRNYSFSTRPSG